MMWSEQYLSIGTPEHETQAHEHIAKKCRHSIVEIGVLEGYHAGILARANPNVKVFGIDPIISDSMNQNLIGNIHRIRENTKGCYNYTFIQDYSYNVVKDWNMAIDYLFIDGDHRYEYVKQDFEQWSPHVVEGGIISIHDSAMYRNGPAFWEGPSKLADEIIDHYNDYIFIKTIFCLTIFRKKIKYTKHVKHDVIKLFSEA